MPIEHQETFEYVCLVSVRMYPNQYWTSATLYRRYTDSGEMEHVIEGGCEFGPSDTLKPAVNMAVKHVAHNRRCRVYIQETGDG